jgi:hypothetical protein
MGCNSSKYNHEEKEIEKETAMEKEIETVKEIEKEIEIVKELVKETSAILENCEIRITLNTHPENTVAAITQNIFELKEYKYISTIKITSIKFYDSWIWVYCKFFIDSSYYDEFIKNLIKNTKNITEIKSSIVINDITIEIEKKC